VIRPHLATSVLFASVVMTVTASPAFAQLHPWINYPDFDSPSRCGVVNAGNAQLAVSSITRQLILVTGSDITLQDTFVDSDGFVFFEGEQFGLIGFAEDGDGFRTLWWLTLTGTLVEIDPLTAVPSATTDTPADFVDVSCDVCDFWDDRTACDEPVVTVPVCGVDVPITLPVIGIGLGVMGFVQRGGRRRSRARGLRYS